VHLLDLVVVHELVNVVVVIVVVVVVWLAWG